MSAGIDFGTSTCSIGVWRDDRPFLLKLEGDSTRLLSALHSSRPTIGVGAIDDEELKKRIADLKRKGRAEKAAGKSGSRGKLTDDQLESRARGLWRLQTERAIASRRAPGDGAPALYADDEIDAICLGRPVNFHGQRGEVANRQAVAIMETAAVAAGFKYVEFMFEPIAAALDYERSIERDVVALVLDAGGGTTDCSMVRIGPSFRRA